MSSRMVVSGEQVDLRLRAVSRLNGRGGEERMRANAPEALGVLFELASSPSTAGDALALLHELQVHQVELDLQAEELRGSRAELEGALTRQSELYDFAPVGCFTVDASTAILETNLRGARLLGFERGELPGQPLDGFLGPRSADVLHTLLARVAEGHEGETCDLELVAAVGKARVVHARAARDPSGPRFLVVLMDAGGRDTQHAT